MSKKWVLFSFCVIVFILSQSLIVSSQIVPKFGVVYGADNTPKSANYEIMRFNDKTRQLPPNLLQYRQKAAMFFRNNKYRSVLLFSTSEEATRAQPIVEKYLTDEDKKTSARNDPDWERGSYVVNLSRWCPQWHRRAVQEEKIKYYRCQS